MQPAVLMEAKSQTPLCNAISTLLWKLCFHMAQNQHNLLDDRKLHAKAGSSILVSYISGNMLHEKRVQDLYKEPIHLQKSYGTEIRAWKSTGQPYPLSKNHLLTHTDAWALNSQMETLSLINLPRSGLLPWNTDSWFCSAWMMWLSTFPNIPGWSIVTESSAFNLPPPFKPQVCVPKS